MGIEILKKIIIDTDIGSDIDDAVALWWLFHQDVEILGITTVTGESRKRCFGIQKLMPDALRKKIPVASGIEVPKNGISLQKEAQLLKDIPSGLEYPNFLSILGRVWNCPPSTLELLCIGPLSNMAELERAHPGSLERFKKITIMGGVFSSVIPMIYPHVTGNLDCEWNILCDPEAAAVVFQPQHKISLIPLDCTHYLRFNMEEWRGIASVFPKAIVSQMGFWNPDYPYVIPHDWIAAQSLMSPKNLQWASGTVSIEDSVLSWIPGKGNHQVALWCDGWKLKEKFFRDFAAIG